MTRLSLFLTLLLLVVSATVVAADGTAGSICAHCRMDLRYAESTRVLVTYADGTSSDLCSLSCGWQEMKRTPVREVRSIGVADYNTRTIIDTRTATWVRGGRVPGGMNTPPLWAFATEEAARRFIAENGGEQTSYDRLAAAAENEPAVGGDESHAAHHHGHGHDMLFNLFFSDDIYHGHPKGMWMANYKYMHMVQRGLRNGTTNVPLQNATPVTNSPFGYMMVPTRMTMDMHMVMVMYGLTDRLTLMGMGTYLDNKMDMVMNMGMGNRPDAPMRSSGIGDTEVRAIYKITDRLTGSLGVSLPTGDIDEEFTTMGTRYRLPYDMQLGSGTVDLKPALTYNALSSDGKLNWGGQAAYTYHPGHNRNGYSLGDNVKVTAWGQRAFGPVAGWVRFSYNYTERIDGRDPKIQLLLDPDDGAPTPDADPRNYGGHRMDGYLGASFGYGPFSVGIEAGIPLYQTLNGLQLKNQWYLTAAGQFMF